MSTINTQIQLLAFDDAVASNNPALRAVDWKRSVMSIPCSNPKSEGLSIKPLIEKVIFDTSVTTGIDNTTVFSLTLSPLDSTIYRLTNTGGTPAAFRTDRAVVVAGGTFTVTTSPNGLVTFTHSATPFGSVQVGDNVFIPGLSTGDPAGPFNSMNEGYWVVMSATTSTLVLARSEDFSGVNEGPVTITANSQFQVFSSAGVSVGDVVEISGGFAFPARKTYSVVSVTASRLEIRSTSPLANETGIMPGIAGIKIFSTSKKFLYIESDQEIVLKINGDSDTNLKVTPLLAGDPNARGMFFKTSDTWRLTITNKSPVVANVVVISAE